MTETTLIIITILILILLGIIMFRIFRKGTVTGTENAEDLRPQLEKLKTEKSAADERISILDQQVREKDEKIAADNKLIIELNRKISQQEADYKNLQERIGLKEKEIIQ